MLFGGFFLVRLFGSAALAFFPGRNNDFEAAVFTRLERAVRLENIVERVSFRNKAARVDEPLLDEGKRLFEPRCIHVARFEDEILAVHAGQRQHLVVLVRCCRGRALLRNRRFVGSHDTWWLPCRLRGTGLRHDMLDGGGDGLARRSSPHFPVPLSCRFVFDFLSKRRVTFPRVALC